MKILEWQVFLGNRNAVPKKTCHPHMLFGNVRFLLDLFFLWACLVCMGRIFFGHAKEFLTDRRRWPFRRDARVWSACDFPFVLNGAVGSVKGWDDGHGGSTPMGCKIFFMNYEDVLWVFKCMGGYEKKDWSIFMYLNVWKFGMKMGNAL